MNTQTPTHTQSPAHGLPAMATRKQLAGYLQISENHLDNLFKRGAFPRVKLGGAVRFPTDRVLAALNQGAASQ